MGETSRKDAMQLLLEPFEIEAHTFKPQLTSKDKTSGLAVSYVDSRFYQGRLDEVDPSWSVRYEVQTLEDRVFFICTLTVCGISRQSTGEEPLFKANGKPNDNAFTSAEAQAFKRACASHGLGRYLYHLPKMWGDYDDRRKRFKPQAVEKFRRILAQATDQDYKPTTSPSASPARTTSSKAQAGQTSRRTQATAAPAGNGSEASATDFWTKVSPLIGGKFKDKQAVLSWLEQFKQNGQTNWSGACAAISTTG
jgi:hypothetical protein